MNGNKTMRRRREERRNEQQFRRQHHDNRRGGRPGAEGKPGLFGMLVNSSLLIAFVLLIGVLPVNLILNWMAARGWIIMSLQWMMMGQFVWFFAVFWTIRMLVMRRHRRLGGFAHSNLLDNAVNALDRIASGDFDITLETDEYNHYAELIDKINEMARNLSSMEHMRQDFVGNVSHEIGSPLTSIQGFARLLRQEDLEPEKREHYLEVIEAECRRLRALSDNLLKLSALDSETVPLQRERFALDRQLRHVVLLLEPQWSEQGLAVSAELEAVSLEGDEALLEQLWINLLQNAIKFTPPGGEVAVCLRREGEVLVCEVRDSGIGIGPENLPHIFERFYKADRARTRGAGGSGLGLSLCKRIAELHGGGIEVESAPGQGSLFRVRLPAAPPEGA